MATVLIGSSRLSEGLVPVDESALDAELRALLTWRRNNPDATRIQALMVIRDGLDRLVPATHVTGLVSRYWQLYAVLSGLGHLYPELERPRRWLVRAAWPFIEDEYKDRDANPQGRGLWGPEPTAEEADPRGDE